MIPNFPRHELSGFLDDSFPQELRYNRKVINRALKLTSREDLFPLLALHNE